MQSAINQSNDEFIRCWNDILVPKWNRFRHILSGNGKIHSDTGFDLLDVQPGDSVLDVGCGYGETCLQLADKVGASGEVVGIDCTEAFLEIGKQELASTLYANVDYILGDAQNHPFADNAFDVAISRFGVMFFENRVAAMKNIHRSLKPGGKMMLIVWRSLKDNYCWNVGKSMTLRHLQEPQQVGATCGPGPFSMANEEMTRGMLAAAGFDDVEIFQQNDDDVMMGSTLEEAIDFQLLVGPSGEIIRESGQQGQDAIPAIREDLRVELSKFLRGSEVWMPSSAWVIVASKAT